MSTQDYFGSPLPLPGNDPGVTAWPTGMTKGSPQEPAGRISPFDFSDFPAGIGMTLDDIWGIFAGPTGGVFGSKPTGAAQEKAGREGTSVGAAVAGNASETLRKAVGIDPKEWQTFIRQTTADWGIYAGLFILLVLGTVFLVSSAGGGSLQPLSARGAPQRIKRTLTGG